MTELILVKTPEVFGDSVPLSAERVVGIISPQSGTITEYGYSSTGEEAEEALLVDDDMAERIVDFYDRCKSVDAAERPFHNCHLLGWYALNAVSEVKYYSHYRSASISPVPTTSLQPGMTYTTDKLNHTVLGVNRPNANLSVVGDNQPLVVSENADLLRAYGATDLRRITPADAF